MMLGRMYEHEGYYVVDIVGGPDEPAMLRAIFDPKDHQVEGFYEVHHRWLVRR